MLDNLKTTHYLDGKHIPNVTDDAAWGALTTGAYCNYANDGSNVAIYGRLYNFYAASNPVLTLAPNAGWRVPAEADWDLLETYLHVKDCNMGLTGLKTLWHFFGVLHWLPIPGCLMVAQ